MDLHAAVEENLIILPNKTVSVPCGISIALPEGYEAQIRPRSGLAAKHGIGMLNSPGTVDSDYRGEIKVILTNFSDVQYTIHRGDRVAQIVIARYAKVSWKEVDTLPDSERGEGGFGHSGR